MNNTFSNVRNLRFLELPSNNIRTLELNAFAGLENVDILVLMSNELTYLEPGTFSSLKYLEQIGQVIEAQLFSENHNLHGINVDRNRINRIAPGFISSLSSLSFILLTNNECINNKFIFDFGDMNMVLAYVHSSLHRCYDNFVGTEPNSARTIKLEYSGSLRLSDEFGNAILEAN